MDTLSNNMENLDIGCSTISGVTVEARMRSGSSQNDGLEYKDRLFAYLKKCGPFQNWSSVPIECPDLMSTFEYVLVGSPRELNEKNIHVDDQSELFLYCAKNSEAYAQELTADDDDSSSAIASLQWELPCRQFDLLWENLFYEDNVKGDLLSFVNSLVHLSQLGIDTNVVDLNRLVLLHGPPGTGKTTLCKGLAQRLAVRLNHKYKKSIFVEVNSHSLFSKWFSESGKFVQKLFDQIIDLACNTHWLIFVLIDEVESLVMERTTCQGSDPSDSVRAVNAVLTQIDKIRRFPNVLVFTTSNITGALDQAFMDRTDISRLIGHPSPLAAAKILHKGVVELNRIGVISDNNCNESDLHSILLKQGTLSGRLLKKLPVLAYARLNAQKATSEEFLRILRETMGSSVDENLPKTENVLREIQNPLF